MKLPAGTQVIDATGKWVTPGIVAGFSRLGLAEVDLSRARVPTTPTRERPVQRRDRRRRRRSIRSTRRSRSIAPTASLARWSRRRSGRNIFAGQGAVIDTGADMDPITAARRSSSSSSARPAPKRRADRAPRRTCCSATRCARRPSSRYAPVVGRWSPTSASPTSAIPTNRVYGRRARSEDVLLTRFDAAALVPVLQGRQYLLVHVERASDILQVLALKREFPSLKIVLVGASEGWTVADRIARAGIPVIASAVNDLPASFEQIAATQSNVGRMRAAGVKVSIGMIDDNDTRNLFEERQYAGNLVALQRIPGATGVELGRGAGDDHLAAGAGDRHGRRDRQPRSWPPRRYGHLVGRPARRVERGRASVYRWRSPAARDPPDPTLRSLSLPPAPRSARGVPALTLQTGPALSAIAFVGTHFLLSHPLRGPLVRAVGEGPFRGIYSLVALVTFAAMIYFYRTSGANLSCGTRATRCGSSPAC